MRRWLAALSLALLAVVGCSSEKRATTLLIQVTSTSLVVPDDVDELGIFVWGEESMGMLDQRFPIPGFPQSYLVTAGSHPRQAVTITVRGLKAGVVRVRRVVPSGFVEGTNTVVVIELDNLCLGDPCREGFDCVGGVCATGGGMDMGPVDGGPPEGGYPDLGCMGDEACDDSVDCTQDSCVSGACLHEADDSFCATDMGPSRVCHATTGCGEACTEDASCDNGTFCDGAERCVDTRCLAPLALACDDVVACTVDRCDEEFRSCYHEPNDALCDADPCTGVETCDATAGCVPGTPVDCDDAVDCTVDTCSGAGLCGHTTRDVDGDGHGDRTCPALGIPADDCDDTSADVRPGAPEVCNGGDDDCDGTPDEDFTCASATSGACMTTCGSTGSRICSATCAWSVCSPPVETCNGADDDCNGACDDGFTCCQGLTTSCTTSCGSTGTRPCDVTCTPGACEVPTESCANGADDDCDGRIDSADPDCGRPCTVDAECDDMLPCNGTERCDTVAGAMGCVPGTRLSCDDGVRCTVDSCDDAVSAGCVHAPDDAFCGDSSFCNGPERCDFVTGCSAGTAPVCDDGVSCTDDSCGGAAPGACVVATRDADGDRHGAAACAPVGGVPADDCDDSAADVYLGAPELCNGRDDDCDTTCDDGFACCRGASGSCTTGCGTTGRRTCSAVCSWGVCSPPAEACNGIDDDCNGACDDGFACCEGSTGGCATVCGSTGSRPCNTGCSWGTCTPPVEACNGVDDDCDGLADNGFTCVAATTGSCTSACGTPGRRTCSAGCEWGSCAPPVELCNGIDDDCDGTSDEDFTCAVGASASCLTGCGTTGVRTCNSGCNWGVCVPPRELCNGLDDNCDTFVDEDFTCPAGGTGSCTSACATTGSRTCSASCAWGSCAPPAETCNGADDDCDGASDNGFACVAGAPGICTTGCGTSGTRVCGIDCLWRTCNPPAETCNGMDDDCDGTIDDGFPCAAATTGSCTSACGTSGTRTCSASCGWGACAAPAETCNGLDDDCDGTSDEGFACIASTSGGCTTTCGSAGSRSCGATCTWGLCNPPIEACNGVDDDCDGMIDELLACVAGSTGSCTTACGSTGSQICSATCNWGTCVPPAEFCNGADDDCDGTADNGFTCASGSAGACTTSCASTGSRVCSAGCAWGACTPPLEFCNGADDDCDGSSDEGFVCRAGTSGACTTACGSTGSRMCSGRCEWDACVPPAEVCNGADDNCDGAVDEGFTCPPGSTSACLASCGTTGVRTCTAACGWGLCVPPAEICNGIDDDCDTFTDETFTCPSGTTGGCTTSCATSGTRLCSATCAWNACVPPAETCNGTDDDCDAMIDEDFLCAAGTSGTCTTSCSSTGSRACSGSCAWGACIPPGEICNGVDDDCDTSADEGFTCRAGQSGSCTTSCLSIGARTCDAACAWGACAPPAEVCNGADDDCDTMVDEGFTCTPGQTGSCTASCGTTGSRVCSASCTWGACTPPAEICNGLDDDCDVLVDETFTCVPASTGACTTGCGTTGARTCTAACSWGACAPPLEACNGTDDNCNAVCDDGFTCCAGSSGSCTTSCATSGTRTCSAACGWSACSPPAEACNGVDDDCNTLCDDGFACCRGATGTCTSSCGSTGARTCDGTCAWGSCTPPVEACNGADDDCDTLVDEGFTCAAGSSRSCTSACATTGTQACSGTCAWGACAPPVEICNGADDDCALGCDNGFACCRGSTGGCTTACGSTGSRTCGATCGWGACAAPAETCNGLDDDCDALVDNGFTCAVGTMSTCTTSCGSTGNRTCGGTCAWGACAPPAEVCNGADDDCDTLADETFACAAGSTGSCTTTCGTTGSRLCTPSCTWGACVPPPEACNGVDDNCDGSIDETLTCSPGAIETCVAGCGTTGSRTCTGLCTWGACTAPTELCNGIDDDCDLACDDGFTCCAGGTGACTTTCSSTGSRTCSGACAWGACTPPAESCNGADDNCNAVCDDGFACCAGSTGACTTGCGTTGTRNCGGTCAWSACSPPAEACNGVDDDCNTLCDDGFACCRGTTGSCVASCGSTGTRTCGASCTWGATCTPPVETCNGLDDDCDALCDDGFTCCAGTSRTCTASCGTTGSQTCAAGSCTWPACVPPTESCNGIDDDCDTVVDDGFACAAGATSSCTAACGTTGIRTCSAACTWGACVAPAEVCNGLDDDCDTLCDDGFTCCSGSTGSCTTSCSSTGSRTCSAACGWGACTPPAEACNGLDDDCTLGCDNGFACCAGSAGACTTSCGSTGSRSCGGTCAWSACSPPAEACNGLDDNCNSVCDDGFTCCAGSTGSCVTSCGTTGTRPCSAACAWGATCTPPAELCNGIDDDCDVLADETFACRLGSTQGCTTGCGSTGTQTCGASCTWGACVAPAEICNGVDDDCDALADEGFTCRQSTTQGCTASCGSSGSQTCGAACTWGACVPPAETCNGADDDCDATCDDGFACCAASSGSCTSSCGSTGTRVCSGTCAWGSCTPPAESCNGADDNCNTVCDDGFACCAGSSGACTTGCGTTGSRTCSGTCAWSACSPPAESCNGTDDDCNSVCDDGFACCAGTVTSCTTSCGSTGSRTCSAACASGACTAPVETCNGIDDDCALGCDNGFTCCAGSTRGCTTSCGSTGTEACTGGCAWSGACAAPAENCTNGVDDDCNALVDGADPACGGACPGATNVLAPGGRYTAALTPHVYQGSCGGAGAEAYFSFTLAAASDVYIATHQTAGINTVLYVRSGSCTGPQVGCNTDADGLATSRLTLTSLAAGSYNVFVDTVSGVASGTVTLDLYITTPGAASDRCGNPTFIPAGALSVAGNSCGYSGDYLAAVSGGCTYPNSGDGVERVYAFYLPTARAVTFSGCGASNYDTLAYIRTICTDNTLAPQVACDDDGCGGGGGSCVNATWRSTFTATIGPGLFYFMADGYDFAAPCGCGDYSYAITGL